MSNFIYHDDLIYRADGLYPEDCHDDCKGFCTTCKLYLNAFKDQNKDKQDQKDDIPF